MTLSAKRPLVRYHGGKWKLAPWIISHFPSHRIYVEPFGGGGSVLIRKPRSYAEVYNDLDGDIVNLFRVTRDNGDNLRRLLEFTPFARSEFDLAWTATEDQMERARRTVIRAFMGFGSAAVSMNGRGETGKPTTGFRSNSNRSGTTPAHDWRNYPEQLERLIDRLRGVVIENRDAGEVIAAQDSAETLFYVDPPYVSATRDNGRDYRHEMNDDDHVKLAEQLHAVSGFVVLSGYPSELYDRLYSSWRRIERASHADGAVKRTEVLWLSPNMPSSGLFDAMREGYAT